jgi:tRNA-2-methylthio-N6-dimethylallyladenosine synthase
MRYHIWTVGCQMNVADSQKLAAGLDRLGWSEAGAPAEADLVVLNTCSIRAHAEQKAMSKLGALKKLRRRGGQFQIAVMGCMVGPKTDDLARRFPYVDVWARPQQFEPILQAAGYDDLGGEFWPSTFALPESVTAYVPIIHGCDKFCTFCIVPYRRGRERSRTIDDIRSEVEHLAARACPEHGRRACPEHGRRACPEHGRRGVREVTLLGQTVEAYGHDLPGAPDLGDLLRGLHDIDGIARYRFLTSYPKDMTERIVAAIAELPKVCEFFNIPVQSGDNAVLNRMRRGYTIEEYVEKVELIRRYMPDAAITTDIIVGFCGETDAEFQHTYDLARDLQFDKIHVAAYSPRPGTIAYRKLEDDVPQETKMARFHAIEQLEAGVSARINSRLLGAEVEVLVEGKKARPTSPFRDPLPATNDPSHGPWPLALGPNPDPRPLTPDPSSWYGRTRQNRLVHFSGAGQSGDLTTVHIERTSSWSLVGTAAR